jgi:hypothetical protein
LADEFENLLNIKKYEVIKIHRYTFPSAEIHRAEEYLLDVISAKKKLQRYQWFSIKICSER